MFFIRNGKNIRVIIYNKHGQPVLRGPQVGWDDLEYLSDRRRFSCLYIIIKKKLKKAQ